MNMISKYFREVSQELQKVSWPTRQQTIDKTLLVVGVSLVVALYLGGLDYLFQQFISLLLTQ